MKLTLLDKHIELKTCHGDLQIPVAEIQKIEFATRISDEVAKKIKRAVADLGSPQFQERQVATAILLQLREKAFPSLLRARKDKDLEVAQRAEDFLIKIRDAVPKELLQRRDHDVVFTTDSKFAGRIVADSLKVNTQPFGEQQVKLLDLRVLGVAEKTAPKNVMPAREHSPDFKGKSARHFSLT